MVPPEIPLAGKACGNKDSTPGGGGVKDIYFTYFTIRSQDVAENETLNNFILVDPIKLFKTRVIEAGTQ